MTCGLSAIIQRLYDVDMGSEAYLDLLSASIVDVLFVGLKVPS